MSPHDKHTQAFGLVGYTVQQVENTVGKALAMAEEAERQGHAAIGPNPVGAGERAIGKIEAIRETLAVLVEMCEEAKTELNAYGLGW